MVLNVREFGLVQCIVTLIACLKLLVYLWRKTNLLKPTFTFVHSRHFRSQVMAPRHAELAFLTSLPQTYGQHPWVIEIEDSTTLFFPFLHNGLTPDLDVKASPYYTLSKALLESESCRGILTHMRSTFNTLPTLFESDIISEEDRTMPRSASVSPNAGRHTTNPKPSICSSPIPGTSNRSASISAAGSMFSKPSKSYINAIRNFGSHFAPSCRDWTNAINGSLRTSGSE